MKLCKCYFQQNRTYLIQNKIKNIFLSVAHIETGYGMSHHAPQIVVEDRIVDWGVAALKVAKREKKTKAQLKKFQSLVSLAKSDHNKTLSHLLDNIKIKPNCGRKNKMELLDAEIKANGDTLKLKHPVLEDIIEWKKIRKLCQEKVSWLKSNN
jgi:hypothetical protein